MRGRRAALAAGLLVTMVAGCGVSTEDRPRLARDDSVPFGLLSRSATTLLPPVESPETEPVVLCFIDGERLSEVQRPLPVPASLGDIVGALIEPPDGSSLRTAVGPPSIVRQMTLTGGAVQVDLNAGVATLGGSNQLLAIAQLVCALTARPGVGQATFTLNGSPINVPRGDGSLTAEPVSRDDYAVLL